MTPNNLVLTLPLILAVAVLVIVPGLTQEQKPHGVNQPRVFDESQLPIAEYSAPEPRDPNERVKRHAKGKKYDKSSWRVHPDDVADNTVRMDFVDFKMVPLPFEKSSIVIIGQVLDSKAFVSNDKTGVYSVFTVQVTQVLKNSTDMSVSSASIVEVEREGGRVRFPNGRFHLYRIGEWNMPKVGLRYVLFLTGKEPNLEIITGYELNEGKVSALDDLPQLHSYDNLAELSFLQELRTKATVK